VLCGTPECYCDPGTALPVVNFEGRSKKAGLHVLKKVVKPASEYRLEVHLNLDLSAR
jgi:hypothetical protein